MVVFVCNSELHTPSKIKPLYIDSILKLFFSHCFFDRDSIFTIGCALGIPIELQSKQAESNQNRIQAKRNVFQLIEVTRFNI